MGWFDWRMSARLSPGDERETAVGSLLTQLHVTWHAGATGGEIVSTRPVDYPFRMSPCRLPPTSPPPVPFLNSSPAAPKRWRRTRVSAQTDFVSGLPSEGADYSAETDAATPNSDSS